MKVSVELGQADRSPESISLYIYLFINIYVYFISLFFLGVEGLTGFLRTELD
jgi:hypothetical protein